MDEPNDASTVGESSSTPGQQPGASEPTCEPTMKAMMSECPCAMMMKRNPILTCVGFAIVFVMFMISQVGGILGIIAFFRTM